RSACPANETRRQERRRPGRAARAGLPLPLPLPPLRRPHDRHRGLRTRLRACASAVVIRRNPLPPSNQDNFLFGTKILLGNRPTPRTNRPSAQPHLSYPRPYRKAVSRSSRGASIIKIGSCVRIVASPPRRT